MKAPALLLLLSHASSLPTERSWGNSWPAGGITSTELADEAVTSSKIAPDAVQPQHLALEAVYGGALQPHAVTRDKLAFGAVDPRNAPAKQKYTAQIIKSSRRGRP